MDDLDNMDIVDSTSAVLCVLPDLFIALGKNPGALTSAVASHGVDAIWQATLIAIQYLNQNRFDDQVKKDGKEALEYWLDCGAPFSDKVIDTLIKEGGGIDIDGVFYGDDEAGVARSIVALCEIFGVERDILKRYNLSK